MKSKSELSSPTMNKETEGVTFIINKHDQYKGDAAEEKPRKRRAVIKSGVS